MRKIFLGIGVLAVFLFGYYQEANCQVNSREDFVQVTIEPVNCRTTEAGVYIFDKAEPLKIKVTLKNISNRKLVLLVPGKQNYFLKVFYFQLLDKGNIVCTDGNRVFMKSDAVQGPERIELLPAAVYDFYTYLNDDKEDDIEYYHFPGGTRFKDLLQQRSKDEYYQIQGIYDTSRYEHDKFRRYLSKDYIIMDVSNNDGDYYKDYYKDVDNAMSFSNRIKLEVKDSQPQPVELGKKVRKLGDCISLFIDLNKINDENVAKRIMKGDGYIQVESEKKVVAKILLYPFRSLFEDNLRGPRVTLFLIPTSVKYVQFTSDSSLKKIGVGKYDIKLVSQDWVSNPVSVEIIDKKDLTESLHSIKIERKINTGTDKRMIEIAENTYPPKNEILEAIKKAGRNFEHIPDPATEKLWWYREVNNVREPYAVTAEAVVYYTNLIERYRNVDWQSDIVPTSFFKYRAFVVFQDRYKPEGEGRIFNRVYVVTMRFEMGVKLSLQPYRAVFIDKHRIVIIDSQGKVLAIFGDGTDGPPPDY